MEFKQVNVHKEVYDHIKSSAQEEGIAISTYMAKLCGLPLSKIYKVDYSEMDVGDQAVFERGCRAHTAAVARAQRLGMKFCFFASLEQAMMDKATIARTE